MQSSGKVCLSPLTVAALRSRPPACPLVPLCSLAAVSHVLALISIQLHSPSFSIRRSFARSSGIRLPEHDNMTPAAAKSAAFNGSAIKVPPHRRHKKRPHNTSTNPLSVLKGWLVKNQIRKLLAFYRLIASNQSHRDAIGRSDCISDGPRRHSAALHCQVLFPLAFQPCYSIVQ